MDHDFNMSMRKFLKQVGVTSQQALEEAMRSHDTAGKSFAVKVTLTCPELDLTHEVDGRIEGQADQ